MENVSTLRITYWEREKQRMRKYLKAKTKLLEEQLEEVYRDILYAYYIFTVSAPSSATR